MKQYSAEFKMEAVKRYLSSGRSLSNVANELGGKPTTLYGLKNPRISGRALPRQRTPKA